MIAESDYFPLSALQHWLYCPRQCALIHLERIWEENRFTAEGRILHERADSGFGESRPGVRIARGVSVASHRLGLSGKCDVVEFHADGSVVPIEYKRGKPKAHRADEVQLCAQAICLEEGLEKELGSIARGFLYYGKRKRRTEIPFGEDLRQLTETLAHEVHDMWRSGVTPPPEYEERKCNACSLLERCAPRAMRFRKGARAWFERELTSATAENPDRSSAPDP